MEEPQELPQAFMEALAAFKEAHPPVGVETKYKESTEMLTTPEIFERFDNHLPETVNEAQLVQALKDQGYVTTYDKIEGRFVWLVGG